MLNAFIEEANVQQHKIGFESDSDESNLSLFEKSNDVKPLARRNFLDQNITRVPSIQ